MPLLKKSFKTKSLSQKDFKTPLLNHKSKIRDIIDYKLNEPEPKKAYNAFVEQLSKEKRIKRTSSPTIITEINKNAENASKQKRKQQKRGREITYQLSFNTDESLSQEQLNKGEIKNAYVEFMNNSLSKEEKNKKRKFGMCNTSDNLIENLSEKVSVSSISQENLIKSNQNGKIIKHKSLEDIFEELSGGTRSKNDISQSTSETTSPAENTPKIKSTRKRVAGEENGKINTHKSFRTKTENNISQPTSEKTGLVENKPKTKKVSKRVAGEKNSRKEKVQSTDTLKSTQDTDFPGLSVEEKMMKLYEIRNVGLYVFCDKCNKARYLPHVVDPLDLPEEWYCCMNADKNYNSCSDPEEIPEEDEEFLINNLYNAGSIVFVHMDGYPWWPAMVEDDPDLESYFWLEGDSLEPTHYHVTFFDSAEVTRAWIHKKSLVSFKKHMNKPEFQISSRNKYKSRLSVAITQATEALDLPLIDRLKTYGFIKRYNKPHKRVKNNVNQSQKNKAKRPRKNKFNSNPSQKEESNLSGILDMNFFDLSFNFLD